MKQVKYLTVFLGDEAMALEARRLVDSQLANGWEISETLSLGMGNSPVDNRIQIQLLHILLKDVVEDVSTLTPPAEEDAEGVAPKVGRPKKEDA